jgi:hypothetical protein
MHIVCIALRVSYQGMARHVCSSVGTMASIDVRKVLQPIVSLFAINRFQTAVRSHASCQHSRKLFRPLDIKTTAPSD